MATASMEYYQNFEMFHTQNRRMSGPIIQPNQISNHMQRRYSVQTDGSHYISHPLQNLQFQQQRLQLCAQKPPLRNVLSAPIAAPNPLMQRKDSLKSPSDSMTGSTTELARYKTELCRPFEETGQCRYGAKCQFAHGMQELRSLNRHPKYKTELCRTFHTTGFCSYGQRCNFIHNEEELKSAPSAVARPPANNNNVNTHQMPKIMPFNFPLTINSTGESPASSIDGESPSHSPCYLNDDVFLSSRLSPTPSYSSDLGSQASSLYSPPGSPKHDQHEFANSLASPLDMGIDIPFFNLVLE